MKVGASWGDVKRRCTAGGRLGGHRAHRVDNSKGKGEIVSERTKSTWKHTRTGSCPSLQLRALGKLWGRMGTQDRGLGGMVTSVG